MATTLDELAQAEIVTTLDETGLGRHVEPDVASIAAAFGKAIAVQGTSPNQSSAKVARVP